MHNHLSRLGLATFLALASASAVAQSYQFKQFSPGIKSTAGFLSSNIRNTEEEVQAGTFSLPHTTVRIPSAIRGEPSGAVIELFALGGQVVPKDVRLNVLYGSSPVSVVQTNCVDTALSEGQSCQITLEVDTSVGRGDGLAILNVDGINSAGAPISAGSSIRWEVLAPGTIVFGAPLNFSNTEVGQSSSPQFFQVGASGAPLTISGISGASSFRVSQLSCQTAEGIVSSFPVTIRPTLSGDICDIGVVFEPTSAVTVSESLTVNDNDESTSASAGVSGTGTAAKTYSLLINRGRQTNSMVASVDGLEFKKAGSWNNSARFVGSIMRTSGKYYVEVQNSLSLTNFGVTGSNTVYESVAADRAFTLASSTLTSLANFGLLVDLDNRTLRVVDSACQVKSPVLALDATSAYTPSFYAHFSSGNQTLVRANFGQYPMNCSFPGFENGWFAQ